MPHTKHTVVPPLSGIVQEDRARILDGAKREVGKVLNENLYEKYFLASEQYAQINDMVFSTADERPLARG